MLSIIIPTLNEEKILENTLGSLKELADVDYELIVADGLSTDQTIEIAKKHAHKVIVHDGKTRQKIGEGKNSGAEAASGDLLLFLDADITIPEINSFIPKALKLFEQNSDLIGLTVFLRVHKENATWADNFFFAFINRTIQISNNLLKTGAAAGEFQMIRTEAFKKVNGYDIGMVIGEDNDMFAKLAKIGTVRSEPSLHVLHTSRRAHKIGWPKLLYLWVINLIYVKAFKKSYSKEWSVIR
ncbi:MAG: aglE 2 [Candidatus Doudnabacteria bacterium]|nr:aglE 2 [Candidatus Doudnabacteria bacterium]